VAIVALLVVMLVGFTAVAYHIGRLLQDKVGRVAIASLRGDVCWHPSDRVARAAGAACRADRRTSGSSCGRFAAVGFLLEYSVWTAGLGAAALVRFNRPAQPPAMVTTTPVVQG
jgi:hypothetical protein